MVWILKNKKTSSETLAEKSSVKNKIVSQGKSKKALLVALFSVSIFLIFSSAQAKAEETDACRFKTTTSLNNTLRLGAEVTGGKIVTYQNCCALAQQVSVGFVAGYCTTLSPTAITEDKLEVPKIRDEGSINPLVLGTKWILIQILSLVGWLFAIAATLFSVVIDPDSISGPNGALNQSAVKDVWIMVRDLLNMAFILVLLFAAFCTIFQVDKWNLKKVWLNILINALLVNFSFPIARFFIDVSNVAFYYFLNHLFPATTAVTGSSVFASFGSAAGVGKLLAPEGFEAYNLSYLIAMIVIIFTVGMTLFIVAALFVVRLVALIMLVMFSPIGFVGYIFPSTAKHADEWWSQLFSYSFFAPIMIFFIAIAVRVTEAIGRDNIQSFNAYASTNAAGNQSNWIAQAAFLVIPIAILWMGIGVAKKAGIYGADSVVGAVKKGGKWLANAPGHYSGVYGGTKKGWEEMRKDGSFLGMNNGLTRLAFKSGVADREAKFGGLVSGGVDGYKDAKRDIARKGANEIRENWKKAGGASNSELENALKGSQSQQMAAALEMAEKNGFKLDKNESSDVSLKRYQTAAKIIASDKVLNANFEDKVKEKHVKFIIQNDIATNTTARTDADIYKEHLDKLSSSKFAGQKGLADHAEVATYLSNRQAGNRNDQRFVGKVAEGMSNEDRLKIQGHGFRTF